MKKLVIYRIIFVIIACFGVVNVFAKSDVSGYAMERISSPINAPAVTSFQAWAPDIASLYTSEPISLIVLSAMLLQLKLL